MTIVMARQMSVEVVIEVEYAVVREHGIEEDGINCVPGSGMFVGGKQTQTVITLFYEKRVLNI